ncbi:MAG: heat shock protein HspQ [Magnetococcales bacterium]|nr:heat shock protein HspQ [Magnetococcales bacterium]
MDHLLDRTRHLGIQLPQPVGTRFFIGQLICHALFEYRGVIIDVDPVFQGSNEWYEEMAKSRPPKDRPWYQVLVDGSTTETYVAERNLQADWCLDPIVHPKVSLFFSGFDAGVYQSNKTIN